MADLLSDSEFGYNSPESSGIQLVKHARSSIDEPVVVAATADGTAAINSEEDVIPGNNINEKNAIFPPEIKEEVSPRVVQGIDLDAILDELESMSGPAPENLLMISSTIPKPGDLENQDAPLNLSKQRIEDVSSSALIADGMPGDGKLVPFQDIAVSSSWRDASSLQICKKPASVESCEEDNQKVSSTTMTIVAPDESPSPPPSTKDMKAKRRPALGSGKKHRYTCKHCDLTTTHYSTLYCHFKRLHPKLLKKGKLVRHYNKTFGLPISNKRNVPMLYACQHCNYITLSMKGFTSHSRQKHPRRKANPLKQGSLVTSSVNRKYLEALYRSGDGPPKNQEKIRRLLTAYHRDSRLLRGESTPTMSSWKSQEKCSRYVCIICDEEFTARSRLNEHYRLGHPEQGPKKNLTTGLFHCKLCPHDSMSRTALRRHYSRSHFIDAFYAWNVPCLEEQFKERDHSMREKGDHGSFLDEALPEASHGKPLEKMDVFMKSTVQWNIEQTTEDQIAESRIPCILCDFSTENIVALMLHYQNRHDGYYPRGFKALLLKGLVAHTNEVDVPESDFDLMSGINGAWLNEDGIVTQLYKFACQLCIFKCGKFQSMSDHFAKLHPCVENSVRYIKPLEPSTDPQAVGLSKDNAGQIVYYCCNWCEYKGDECAMRVHYSQCHSSHVFDPDNLRSEVMLGKRHSRTCFACEFCSNEDIDLAFHYQRQHFGQVATFTTPLYDDGYQCLLCMAITPSLAGMIRHHRKHRWRGSMNVTTNSDGRVLKCLYCTRCRSIFASPQHLWGHVVKEHIQFSLLICVVDLPIHVVKFGFWREEDMPGLPPVLVKKQLPFLQNPGTLLDASTTKRKSKQPIKGFKGGKKTSPYTCSKCFKVLNTGKEYVQHVCKRALFRRSKDASQMPGALAELSNCKVRCKFCSLTTTHMQNLRRHLQAVHRHDTSYRCFKCSNESVSIVDCVRHHQHLHGLSMNRQTAHNFLLNDIVTISEGHGKFMCAWCGYRGLSRMSVLNHFNSRHICGSGNTKVLRKDSKFFCKWCDYYSRNATSMRAHARARHNRVVSYHSLRTLRAYESFSSESSDQSDDEDYRPPKHGKRFQGYSLSSKRANFGLIEDCAFSADSDLSDEDVFRSTHVRCKHQIRYPHVCKFCMKAFVCSTKFFKHCTSDHPNWCSFTSGSKNVLVVPDPKAVLIMHAKIAKLHDEEYSKGVFHGSEWQCELCTDNPFKTLLDLQDHVWAVHNGKKIFMCKYCEFISFNDKKAALHGHQHFQSIQQQLNPPCGNLAGEKDDSKDDKAPVDFVESNASAVCNTCSDIEIISDHTEDNLPDLNPVSRMQYDDITEIPHKRARKSIRGSAALVQDHGSHSPELFSNLENDRVVEDGTTIVEDSPLQDLTSVDDVNVHFAHSVCYSGLIRCNKCDFCCTDSERMASHMKSSHMSMKQYACKFCDFISEGFANLDDHLAEFHKIKRNHQLGLQMRFAMQKSNTTTEAAMRSISEMKSRFLYTPTPSLPIIRGELKYLPTSPESVIVNGDDVEGIHGNVLSDSQTFVNMKDFNPELVGQTTLIGDNMEGLHSGETTDRFKCSYCGHVAISTHKLEMHMKRHEGNFQQSYESIDSIEYSMAKMDVMYKFQ